MYAERTVILASLQIRIGYPGISTMKSLIMCYKYWPKMDHDIVYLEKLYRGCSLAAKASPIKFQPWSVV